MNEFSPSDITKKDLSVSSHLSFDDNQLLPLLFGEQEKYLQRIEQKLGVSISARGGHVTITGEEAFVKAAKAVLENLYYQLKHKEEVEMSDVDIAVRVHAPKAGEAAKEAAISRTKEAAGDAADALEGGVVIKTKKKYIRPCSPNQKRYMESIYDHDMVFALGPAGTGKTYLAVAMAVSMLLNQQVERIILTRPAVEAGEKLGFLPGDMKEKVDPYLQPLYDALNDMLPVEQVQKYIETKAIEIAPLAFMRGRTLSNAFIILDEAQNSTPIQMKMFLTRFGEGSKMIIQGDITQTDLPSHIKSGLRDALEKLRKIDDIARIDFTAEDVIRHPLTAKIIDAYAEHQEYSKWNDAP